MNIQWFPGHMKKTKDLIIENLNLVDVVIEIVDARMPEGSKNPIMNDLVGNKKRIIVLNKIDLADDRVTKKWEKYYAENGIGVVLANSITGVGLKQVYEKSRELLKEKIESDLRRGRINRPIRAMVVGIPNVGKSTFINKIAGRKAAKVGDKAGVTRGKQWIKLNTDFELLDMPGILWPKFEDEVVGQKLASIGSINDDILDKSELVLKLIGLIKLKYKNLIETYYKIDDITGKEDIEILEMIALSRKHLIKNSEIDYDRTAKAVIDDFRNVKIGRISLEEPLND